MLARESVEFERVFRELKRRGLLLITDARLPSVVSLVAEEAVRGSWWAHSKAHTIVRVLMCLSQNPDVVVTKLVSNKLTLIHRKLWPALWRVCNAEQDWQFKGLSPAARWLLAEVTRRGELRTDRVRWKPGHMKSSGEAARELESKLLVYSGEIHTETGAHSKRLETWARWARRVGLVAGRLKPDQAKRTLEQVLEQMNKKFGGTGRFPWQLV